ncbi:FAD-dependent monooxygenase [Occultella kanbiaonis]|uniref:FAD-dependent monooxygenase n=1 Tax=Occultella kanbiaonis TaxID=2675754 RepID=UPI0012B6DB23|nr:FAD-dependent monooxygenase [Occultella kanbiaonis]
MNTLIVGAGPTGMVAALALTMSGVRVRIIDKRYQARSSSRALGLQARSMEVLAGLGVAQQVEQVAYRLRGASIMRGDTELVDLRWVPPESRYPHTYVLPQTGAEEILRGRLQEFDVAIERGVELAGLSQHERGVEARLADGAVIEAHWVIGADGASSRVREAAGIAFPERATGETYYLADVLLDLDLELGDSAMWLGPEGPLMLMRLPGDGRLWRLFVDVTDAAQRGELPELNEKVLAEMLADRGPTGVRIAALQWTSVFRTRLGLADAYRTGRVFLAGDAAHVFPPFGGQGMNLGIQDAVNLAWRLAAVARGAEPVLLDGYERERRPVAAATIKDVDARRRMYAMRNPIARAARDLLLRAGGRSGRAARLGSLQNSQLATTYRDRVDGGERGPEPRPGDRAPDGRFAGASVHELFGAGHATVLAFEPEAVGETVSKEPSLWIATVPGRNGDLRERYGIPDGERGYVLVRPDGHVAERGDEPAAARLAIEAQ